MLAMTTPRPPVPQPPHDPTWWLLDGRVGWRPAHLDGVTVSGDGALRLALRPDAGRQLVEATGSLGGLVPPLGVALAPGGDLYLLDRAAARLRRFNRCVCRFEDTPCLGGPGQGPRQLTTPGGISICRGNLFVGDTGNGRLSVFSLVGYALRGHWRPPAGEVATPWQPLAVACDSRGRVFVTDPANGCIHRFSRQGRWQTCLPGFGKATQIAVDCDDRLVVVIEGEPAARIVDGDGNPLGTATRPDELADRFPRLPFEVDAQGRLYLLPLCPTPPTSGGDSMCRPGPFVALKAGSGATPRRERPRAFDLTGALVEIDTPPAGPLYVAQGVYVSGPLDSRLYRCQWHRVTLDARLPQGTRIVVSTFTSETDQPLAALLEAEEVWQTRQTVRPTDTGEWDALVRSGGGRYLWLRLELFSSGAATPTVENARVEFPRISLRRYLPAVFGEDAVSADFTDRFLSLFDTTLRGIEQTLDSQARFYDPLATPATRGKDGGLDFLSWLATWVGVSLDRQWSEERRRQWLKAAPKLYPLRGTREGLRRALVVFLGLEAETLCCPCDGPRDRCCPLPANCALPEERPCAWQPPALILEHYQLRRWLFVGQARLGEQARLWGQRIVNRSQLDAESHGAQLGRTQLITTQDPLRDPFHVYAHKFTVFVPARYGQTDAGRKSVENLIRAERPAHTDFQIEYVQPRFRIGVQSMLGYDAVIGRYPEGVTLGETALGPASVIGPDPAQADGPALVVGHSSRVGATTRLT